MKGTEPRTHSSADNFEQEPEKSSEYEMLFPPEHALTQLWAIWNDREGSGESLHLNLRPEEARRQPFLVRDPDQECRRAQVLLTHLASVRVHQIASHASGDELAVVFPSKDGMMAWLFLFPPFGAGKLLSAAQIHEVLRRRGVTYGINWTVICSMADCDHRHFYLFPIAAGKAPVPGRDGQILDRYPRTMASPAKVDELAQANYQTLNLVREIKQGDVICEIIPPKGGMSGRTVMGEAIPAPQGKPAEVPQGRNTGLSEDGMYLVAQRDGHLCFTGRSFQVRPVLHLYQDSQEQDVRFLGDIHIHGDLGGGACVRAIGNIQVDGVIEVCTMEAGENIIVSSGVQGQGRAELHAQKSVYAKYLENCSIYAQESVQADCIINCEVYSNGDVRVRTGRGVIIGGTIRAAQEVSASTVGSKAERTTLVILGGKPCEEAERTQILAEIQGMERQLERLGKEPDSEGKRSKLRLDQCVAKMKLEKMDKDLEEQAKACIACDRRQLRCGTAYPGTTVSMDRQSYKVAQEERDCVIRFVNGFLGRQ